MRSILRVLAAAGLSVTAAASFAGSASASPGHSAAGQHHGHGVVFVQTNNPAGNTVVAYRRGADGALTLAGSHGTGGDGGSLSGAVVDRTASQGALAADRAHHELYAVNAGSNTISVLAVHGQELKLRQVIDSGGAFPVSVTVHGDLVYVLDARDGGAIQGYRITGAGLRLEPAWHRALGLGTAGTPEFTHTPGQISFSPDGRHLVVTTKAASNSILVYGVARDGRPAATPTVRTEPGAVPFAVTYDQAGHVVVADAGTNAISSYAIRGDGTLAPLSVTPTGQAATCWVTSTGNLLAASNAGSGTVTTLLADAAGHTSILANTPTGAGTVDASFSPDGANLYVQTGAAGAIASFTVGAKGQLTATGSVTVPDAVGAEGIIAY